MLDYLGGPQLQSQGQRETEHEQKRISVTMEAETVVIWPHTKDASSPGWCQRPEMGGLLGPLREGSRADTFWPRYTCWTSDEKNCERINFCWCKPSGWW